MASKNEHLVSKADLRYYKSATVDGLKLQLQENDLPTGGLKYDLYERLVDAGVRLYTDDRSGDEIVSQEGSGQEGSDPEGSYQGGSEEEDSDEPDEDEPDSDEPDDDQGRDGRGGGKRRRDDDDDDSDISDEGDDGGRPRRKRVMIGRVLPLELQHQIIERLPPSALWNLIEAAPEVYLSDVPGGINALRVEAEYQRRLDHPPLPPERPRTHPDGGPVLPLRKTPPPRRKAPPPDDSPERPLSLLEWVGRRATYEARFRAANRTRISRVVDEYLAAYGEVDPDPGQNPRDDILYYFRPRPNFQALLIPRTPLTQAALNALPHVVHLLLRRGAPVNQVLFSNTALDLALTGLGGDTGITGEARVQTAFALLGAGADVSSRGVMAEGEANSVLEDLTGVAQPGDDPDFDWPRIDNPFGLSIRQFIADERSSYFDRMLLAMYAIFTASVSYPTFI